MGNITVLIAMAVLSFVSVYSLFQIGKKEELLDDDDKDSNKRLETNALKIFFFFLLMSSLLLVGKVAFDDRHYCDVLVNQTTTTNNVTDYTYERVCFDNDNNSALWAWKIPLIFLIMGTSYMFIYLIRMLLFFGKEVYKKWQERR